MKKIILSTLLIVLYALPLLADDRPIEASAKLESATVLMAGAELSHTAQVKLSSGSNDVLISGISPTIDVNSLQISCSGGVTVLSSVFETNYLYEQANPVNVKRLKDSIEKCNDRLLQIDAALKTNTELQALLQANKAIGGQQNGLNVTELMKMMDYYKAMSTELQKEKYAYDAECKKIKEAVGRLKNQLIQEETKNAKEIGQLRLKLASPTPGTKDIKVGYYTSEASWKPYYDIQATDSSKPIKILCKANFSQTTGLDWNKAKLTLSTATPSNGKVAPLFSTWFLQYVAPQARYQNTAMQNSYFYKDNAGANLSLDEEAAVAYGTLRKGGITGSASSIRIRGTGSSDANTSPLYIVNGEPMEANEALQIDPSFIDKVDVLNDAESTSIYGARASNGVVLITLKDKPDDFVTESENQNDVTYELDQLFDLKGNGNEQTVTLRTLDVPATFEHYSAPKLDKSVFLLAKLTDWEKLNLLPGEANLTSDGTYVGKTFINPYSTNKELSLTLGTDKRVSVKREKMQDFSSTKFLGSDKKQVFTYQLTVKNNKNTPIQMTLKDQYPTSTLKEIEVEVLETSKAEVNQKIGVVHWSFELKPGETKTVKLSYSVKYPKGKSLNL